MSTCPAEGEASCDAGGDREGAPRDTPERRKCRETLDLRLRPVAGEATRPQCETTRSGLLRSHWLPGRPSTAESTCALSWLRSALPHSTMRPSENSRVTLDGST